MNSTFIGHQKIWLESVDSTNNFAANLLNKGDVQHGTVILADNQYNGRGQRGTTWQSLSGKNLTFSVVILPERLLVKDQFKLTQIASLALVELLKSYSVDAKIKWPNDILVSGVKVCGMLIENQLSGDKVKHSVMGIGLNVNQNSFDVENATSLMLQTGIHTNREEVLEKLLTILNRLYRLYIESNTLSDLTENYLSKLWLLNEEKVFLIDGVEQRAMISGVSPEGYLLMETVNGEKAFDLKQVKFPTQNDPLSS